MDVETPYILIENFQVKIFISNEDADCHRVNPQLMPPLKADADTCIESKSGHRHPWFRLGAFAFISGKTDKARQKCHFSTLETKFSALKSIVCLKARKKVCQLQLELQLLNWLTHRLCRSNYKWIRYMSCYHDEIFIKVLSQVFQVQLQCFLDSNFFWQTVLSALK